MSYETSKLSYSNNSNYSQQRESLSNLPKLHSIAKDVSFRVCLTYRDQNNTGYVNISDDNTLDQLKQKICRQLDLPMKPTDFSLVWLDKKDNIWIRIIEENDNGAIVNLKLPSYTILSVEKHEETNISLHQTSTVKESEVTLKLCKRPMEKSNFIYLGVYSSTTIGQLKEQARERVTSQRTHHLSLWTEEGWIKLETDVDDSILSQMGFDQYSIISFETEDDPIPGVCGLSNLGNTCFMNSALQCLSNIPKLTRKILSFGEDMNAPIIGAYSALIKTMWSGKHVVATPSSLLLNIRESLPRFSRYKQQDAQEFMNYFIHLIHQELTSEKTLITNLFYGEIRSSVKCQGGCGKVETIEETTSFLPLPMEDDVNQYNILYLRSNGEIRLVSVNIRARTIDTLIESFIKEHEPELSFRQIQAVKLVDNKITDRYSFYKLIDDSIKYQLTFIEYPKKTVEQIYVEVWFLERNTCKPFRPPVIFVRPDYCCRYSDLIEQITCIQKHLCSVIDGPISATSHIYWTNERGDTYPLNAETNRDDTLLFMSRITIEMDPEWVQKYEYHYNFNRPSSNASLNSLLADFFREDTMNGDYYCSQCCNLNKAKQKADFALPLPLVLIIQLKRFTYDTSSDAKIDTYVDFPLQDLDLRQYVIPNDAKKINELTLYDLVAVSNHTGSLVNGHYTTYAKNHQNRTWYSFSDEYIREITDEKDIVTKNAYILVYVKQTVRR